ncbi:hypothetical protein Taro_016244, partial [Colocasia esculenta]|nr:hypothetical protein [Colocasia esculenta]
AIWKPAWLETLGTERFFVSCAAHETEKKNEKNICCLDCCTSICPHCVPSHRLHRLVQVRRYVYNDVVRVEDLEKLIDCSNVQSYTINSSKVVFIRKRAQSRHFKGSGNICTSCDRVLQEPYIHCSLGCKVDFVLRQKEDISAYLRTCDSLQLNPDFVIPRHAGDDVDANDTTQSTVVDGDDEPMTTAGSSDSENQLSSVLCTAGVVRKKRSGFYACGRTARGVSNGDPETNVNRRKGIPHRSPLC